MRLKLILFLLIIVMTGFFACQDNKSPKKIKIPAITYKGLYSFGPEVKSFKQCNTGREFWAADSSAQLELQYAQLQLQKPDEPVYVELQGDKIKSTKDGLGSDYDSIIVVRKLIKLSKDIPKGMCN